MRSDMTKVLTERERQSSHLRYRPVRHRGKLAIDEEGELVDERRSPPPVEGMRAVHGYERKMFSDHLTPLVGYLRKACGRKWNEVYSEICTYVKLDSTQQRHLRDHVDGYVAVNTFIEKRTRSVWVSDKVTYRHGRRTGTEYPVEGSRWDFYVHPRTGVLTKTKTPIRVRTPRKPVHEIKLDEMTELHKIDGIWYRIEFAPFPDRSFFDDSAVPYPMGVVRDAVTHQRLMDMAIPRHRYVYIYEKHAYGYVNDQEWPNRYATNKTQLGSAELKERKLKND